MTDQARQPVARLSWPEGERLLYPGQPVRLGRSKENDIIFDDPKVSRSHALIEWNGAGFSLRDLGSSNGTLLNDERLGEVACPLRDEDQIGLGRQALRYTICRAEPEPPDLLTEAPPGNQAPRLPGSGPMLLVVGGPDLGQEYPLWGERITIGRASREATWEIRLTDRSVSRPHARLERRETSYYLVDLGSANGTLLNGMLVQGEAAIRDADILTVGDSSLVFQDG
jgi:pSer/pThr/pTyr-binding forkhead associated (FHA) protein